MAVLLYEGMGYEELPSSYRRGVLSGARLEASGYTVRRYNPEAEGGGWEALAPIYAAYNKERSMSMVRERLNWDVIARRFEESFHGHTTAAYVALTIEGDTLAGYALAHFSTAELARRTFDLDQVFTISELGALPGQEGAIPALLDAVVGEAAPGRVGGHLYLPRGNVVDPAIQCILGETLQDVGDRLIMALPLSEEMGYDELRAMAQAPGAWFWFYDAF
jgi:hypothetical protein